MGDVLNYSTRSDEEIVLSLRGGGGTGYSWKPIGDIPSVATVSKEYSLSDGSAVGGLGKEQWKLKFSAPGTYELQLGFTSPSGDDVDEIKTFKFDVK